MLPIYKPAMTRYPQEPQPSGPSAFGTLSKNAQDELEQISYPVRYPGGFVLFAEGDVPRGVFIVHSGHVKVSICSGDGKTLILRMASVGDVLGLPSTLSGRTCEVTAETLGPCDFAFVRRNDFLKLTQRHLDVCRAVADQLVSIYSSTCHEIRCIGLSYSMCGKLANLLLSWPLSNGDAENQFKFAFTHEELAQMIGASRETVSRILADFKRKRIAELIGSTLRIYDRPSLEAVARGARLVSISGTRNGQHDLEHYSPSDGP